MSLRRAYFDGRFGQLHVRCARPEGAGSLRGPAIVCLHQSPKSGRQMQNLVIELGRDRLAYAPDFPGFGESDPPPTAPCIEDYAAAIGDLLDVLGHWPVDLYGYHTGALSAVELAINRPSQIRRLVLVGLPMLDDSEREAIRSSPWPVPVERDGSHLVKEWNRAIEWAGPGQTLETTALGFIDKLKAGDKGFWGASAAAAYRLDRRLPLVEQPILAIGPKDDLWEISPRAIPLMKRASFEYWPEYGFGLMDVATQRLATAIRAHLDRALPDEGALTRSASP